MLLVGVLNFDSDYDLKHNTKTNLCSMNFILYESYKC